MTDCYFVLCSDTLTEGMEVADAPHPWMPQVTWVSADTLTEGMEVADVPHPQMHAPSNLGIHGYSDRGDGGSRCASATDAPSNLGIRGYSDRLQPHIHECPSNRHPHCIEDGSMDVHSYFEHTRRTLNFTWHNWTTLVFSPSQSCTN